MSTDAELLRRYVEENSEAAFAELVRTHLDLVYFAALRQVGGDAHRAKDVAQTVFTDLARKARSLTGRETLAGWLHTSTRFAAAKLRRADFTRQHHEQEATTMNALLQPDPARPEPVERAADWERLRPLIDDAIHELDERDREAVLLRYFENRAFAEIGATLRLSDDAARMRVDRALEKLRATLARRGVKSTGAALALAFANQVAATAPAGLAGSITGAALATSAASAGFFMSTTTAILSAVAIAAIGSTAYEWNRAFRAESEFAALTVDRDGLRAKLRAEQQNAARTTQDLAAVRSELDALKAKQAAMLAVQKSTRPVAPQAAPSSGMTSLLGSQQRAVLNNLRQLKAAINQFALEHGRPPSSLDEIVGEKKYVRALVSVNGESYAGISFVSGAPLVVTMADGHTVTFDPVGGTTTVPDTTMTPEMQRVADMQKKIEPSVKRAMEAYRATNNGATPKGINELNVLIPYFATPQEGADFVEFLEALKQAQAQNAPGK